MSSRRVTDPTAVARLLDPRRIRYLVPYLAKESSISEAASQLGVSVATMSYQTKQLQGTGLIEPVATRKRRGRPQAIYRSTADEFRVGLSDVGAGDLESFILDSEQPFRKALARGLVAALANVEDPAALALRLQPSSRGGIDFEPITAAGRPIHEAATVFTSWMTVALSPEDVAELHRDLLQLWAKWHNRKPRGQHHLIRLAFSPLQHDAATTGRGQPRA